MAGYGGMSAGSLGKAREYGKKEFQDALSAYEKDRMAYGDLIQTGVEATRTGLADARRIQDYFRPGGEFGAGLKQEGKEAIERGVAKDTALSVASGMPSALGARGINVLAGREYAKQAADVEDLRATREIQATTPYSQMIQSLNNLVSSGVQLTTARPSYAREVRMGSETPPTSRRLPYQFG